MLEALNKDHKVLQSLDEDSLVIFIWDDAYFRNCAYSLRRLVFIYETLCQMPLELVQGNNIDHIKSLAPSKIKTFFTTGKTIVEIIHKLAITYDIEIIRPQPFVTIRENQPGKRFFNYWNKAKKTAFLKNGEWDA